MVDARSVQELVEAILDAGAPLCALWPPTRGWDWAAEYARSIVSDGVRVMAATTFSRGALV